MNNDQAKPNIPTSATNVQEIIRKGDEIYSGLKSTLEPKMNGKFIVIEVESGEHFIGETREEAVAKAGAKFPNKLTFSRRIGEPEKVSRTLSRLHNYHDRTFRR